LLDPRKKAAIKLPGYPKRYLLVNEAKDQGIRTSKATMNRAFEVLNEEKMILLPRDSKWDGCNKCEHLEARRLRGFQTSEAEQKWYQDLHAHRSNNLSIYEYSCLGISTESVGHIGICDWTL
jgi:hypothetical protein